MCVNILAKVREKMWPYQNDKNARSQDLHPGSRNKAHSRPAVVERRFQSGAGTHLTSETPDTLRWGPKGGHPWGPQPGPRVFLGECPRQNLGHLINPTLFKVFFSFLDHYGQLCIHST